MKKQVLFIVMLLAISLGGYAQIGCSAAFTISSSPAGVYTLSASNVLGNPSTANYIWMLGNGASAIGSQTSVTYNAPGTYTICLVVQDSATSCVDSMCQMVTYGGLPTCSAAFSYTTSGNGTYSFAASNASTNPASTMYNWSFDGGVTWSGASSSTTANHTFTGVSTANVILAIANQGNTCVDTSTQSITISSTLTCNASFYIYPDSNNATPSTYIGVNTSTGTGLTYNWSWGDGSASTGANPSHTYATPGTYNICLVVISNASGGCVDSFCLSSIINKNAGTMYTVNFGASPAGVNNIETTQLALVPNPTTGNFSIQGNQLESFQVNLFDVSGRLVYTKTVKGQESMNISHLPNSIYSARIIDSKGNSQSVRVAKK